MHRQPTQNFSPRGLKPNFGPKGLFTTKAPPEGRERKSTWQRQEKKANVYIAASQSHTQDLLLKEKKRLAC